MHLGKALPSFKIRYRSFFTGINLLPAVCTFPLSFCISVYACIWTNTCQIPRGLSTPHDLHRPIVGQRSEKRKSVWHRSVPEPNNSTNPTASLPQMFYGIYSIYHRHHLSALSTLWLGRQGVRWHATSTLHRAQSESFQSQVVCVKHPFIQPSDC